MARPRKAPTVGRRDGDRARPFYVYAYPGGTRRTFTFAERDEAEGFVALVLSRGADYASGAYDRRRMAEHRTSGAREPLTLAALAAEFASTRPKASTRQSYSQQARYLSEYAPTASLDVSALTVVHLTGYAEFLRTRSNGRGGTLGANTVRMAWVLARTVLDRAMRNGLVEHNVARAVEDQPRQARRGTEDSTAHAIDRREFEAIANHLAPDVRAFVEVLWSSGLRVGEALALVWDDVQPAAQPGTVEVFVRRSMTLAEDTIGKGGGTKRWVAGTTKSGRARRVYVRAEAFAALDRRGFDERVFEGSRDYYAHAWRRARAKAAAEGYDVARVRLHDLRHSRVTNLLRAGAAAHLVSETMGHSSVAFTLDRYAHAIPSDAAALAAL